MFRNPAAVRLAALGMIVPMLGMAGCKTVETLPEPPPVIVRVPVDRYIPVPESLTRLCVSPPLADRSVASVVETSNARKLCEDRLNQQMREIRGLATGEVSR